MFMENVLTFFPLLSFVDMELKKLHMGTMSYSMDTMDEISTHLDTAYSQQGNAVLWTTSRFFPVGDNGILIY
jgi:hypothetical protein